MAGHFARCLIGWLPVRRVAGRHRRQQRAHLRCFHCLIGGTVWWTGWGNTKEVWWTGRQKTERTAVDLVLGPGRNPKRKTTLKFKHGKTNGNSGIHPARFQQ